VQTGEWPGQDEVRIAELLGWPLPVGLWATGAMAGAVILWVVGRLPVPLRLPFVVAGAFGCAAGYALWYAWLGPLWLP
jgi:hypothetical protein